MVIGGGGHAKVVISTLQAAGHQVSAIFDDNARKWGSEIFGVRVRGPIAEANDAQAPLGIIGIGDNALRRKLAQRLDKVRWATAIHPTAYVDRSVQLQPGTVVFAGAVIQPDAMLGHHVIVNTGASVDHDCAIGDFVHLAPGVHLAGNVRIEEGALLGIGTSVIPGRRIGSWTTVGAGAAVVGDLPPGVVARGVPARY